MPGARPAPIAVSLGDPAGIGPEVILRAFAMHREKALPRFVVCGGAGVLERAGRTLDRPPALRIITDIGEFASVTDDQLAVLGDMDAQITPGFPDEASARLALASLELATRLATMGTASAVVTGPVAKAGLAKIGFGFPGQTEFLADACAVDADDAVMMLAGPSLRTVPVTVHCPLAEVSSRLSADLIVRRARIAAGALRTDFAIAAPRLAVAGLNPHAGEQGRMGEEEQKVITPAIAALRSEGIDASGPHPADTLFAPHKRAGYDLAIAMYHDQALIPLKTLDFDEGVNVTLGLTIIRTSPDHGTAFDIAGKGLARADAMIAALRMAGECAHRRTAADAR